MLGALIVAACHNLHMIWGKPRFIIVVTSSSTIIQSKVPFQILWQNSLAITISFIACIRWVKVSNG